MGQYRHHVFVCTSGTTCPLSGSVAVHAALKKRAAAAGMQGQVRINHGRIVEEYLYVAPPGDNKIETAEAAV
jgi:hypothetical protein